MGILKLPAETGTFNGVLAGAVKATTAVHMGQDYQLVDKLSCTYVIDGETDTITLTGRWEGSDDKSTWYPCERGGNGAADVAIVTGTAGADAAVTRVSTAPDSVYGFVWARFAVVVGVTTGTTNDTYSFTVRYRKLSGLVG